LFGIVQAADALGFGFCLGQGWEQHASEDRNDGDDHQQLDERKAGARPARVGVTWLHAAFQVWAGDMGENAMAK
jgi:hypothetical protein